MHILWDILFTAATLYARIVQLMKHIYDVELMFLVPHMSVCWDITCLELWWYSIKRLPNLCKMSHSSTILIVSIVFATHPIPNGGVTWTLTSPYHRSLDYYSIAYPGSQRTIKRLHDRCSCSWIHRKMASDECVNMMMWCFSSSHLLPLQPFNQSSGLVLYWKKDITRIGMNKCTMNNSKRQLCPTPTPNSANKKMLIAAQLISIPQVSVDYN